MEKIDDCWRSLPKEEARNFLAYNFTLAECLGEFYSLAHMPYKDDRKKHLVLRVLPILEEMHQKDRVSLNAGLADHLINEIYAPCSAA